MVKAPSRLIRPKEVRQLLGNVSNATLYRWVESGKLPRPVKIVSGGRASGWPEDQISKLINRQIAGAQQ
jgi:predicted DNA-binding transcriptional regulator AlpA